MVPGWTEREFHALDSLRTEWIRAGQRNGQSRKARPGSRLVSSAWAVLARVTQSARRWHIAQCSTVLEATASARLPGRWHTFAQRVMQGEIR